jgi:diguanylate cyclase (GGDEF)-like protein
VQSALEDISLNRRVMAYTAAAMYGAAALDGLIEGLLPGDPRYSALPVVVVLVILVAVGVVGPRLPRWGLFLLGPLGVALVSYALATTPGAGDGAVLYAMPVLWTTLFFGRRGAIAIVACVGVGHLIALLSLPAASSYPGRWVDVMVSVCAISLVVLVLQRSNELLLIRLRGEARTDLLTGLLNRRGFDERAAIELAHAKRESRSIAVAIFDLDRFKHINDEWGHQTGDLVLARIGTLIAGECRDIDVAARFGGEEFVVLLPGVSCTGAEAFTERVRQALRADSASDLPSVRVSAGVHAAVAPPDIQIMLRSADAALYEAKRAGRDRTVISGSADSTPSNTVSLSL